MKKTIQKLSSKSIKTLDKIKGGGGPSRVYKQYPDKWDPEK